MSDDDKPTKRDRKPEPTSIVLVDYLGTRKPGPALGAEIREGVTVTIYADGDRPPAHQCGTLGISGSPVQLWPGLNPVDKADWDRTAKHKIVAKMIKAGDIVGGVEIPRRQADRCALASRTYSLAGLALIEAAETQRGGPNRSAVTTAIARQKGRIAKRTPAKVAK